MVHHRLNEREANPNPHINFITALPTPDPEVREEARQLLRALAAQVRPVMKAHGLVVNSMEEYEYNNVFAGRNWESGEVVEIVLRRANGLFLPNSWLLSTLCHELAHIKHMDHGPAFQSLWRKFNSEVRTLQNKGYYGDGYWSSGIRLADSARVSTQSLQAGDLPEYMCGGAQTRARPAARKRRRGAGGSSDRTGAQTTGKRKASSRVTAKGTFKGKGIALNEDLDDEKEKKVGTGFRKKAGSKRAKDERALAAEKRLQALQGTSTRQQKEEQDSSDSGDDSDEFEDLRETDHDRRTSMLEAIKQSELDHMKAFKIDYSDDFIFPPRSGSSSALLPDDQDPLDIIDISSDEDPMPSRKVPSTSKPGHASGTRSSASARALSTGDIEGKTKACGSRDANSRASKNDSLSTKKQRTLHDFSSASLQSQSSERANKPLSFQSRSIVEGKVRSFKTESLASTLAVGGGLFNGTLRDRKDVKPPQSEDNEWSCMICTLHNRLGHLACSACGTPRGDSSRASG